MPWQAILIILAVVALYVLADAIWDVSKQVSWWWRTRRASVAAGAVSAAGRAASAIGAGLAWLWRWKVPLLALAAFIIIVSLMRGCSIPGFKSAGELRLERDMAIAETKTQVLVNERDADIARIERSVALMRQELRSLAQRGRDEIAAAAPENEPPLDPELVAAWRRSLDRLCVPRADHSRADTCRP